MIDLEHVLVEIRSQTKSLSDPIQQLSSFENQPNKKYTKLVGILNETYERLMDLLDAVPSSPLFISNDPNFMLYLRHDMRNPLSVLISDVTIIDQLHGSELSAEQHEAAHTIEHIANDLINYLEAFD